MKRALETPARIFQLHDPELLPIGLALKRRGMTVIFDAHEDLALQTLSKRYIPVAVRRPLGSILFSMEKILCRRLDQVITATPAIRDRFSSQGLRADDIRNYPILGEWDEGRGGRDRRSLVCYVGGIEGTRGIRQLVQAMALTKPPARLALGGPFHELRDEVATYPGWRNVDERGILTRDGVSDLLNESRAGLVTLLPTPAYLESLPIKMFEYMSAGLPVIASNFPLWREIVEGNDCGICVDPLDPAAIAGAIDFLIANPDIADRMGDNGKRAVHERFNWDAEERKLFAIYDRLAELNSSRPIPPRPIP